MAGISALMVNAPGESRVWSLDPMLPVVLGSLAGLLLAVQLSGAEVRHAGGTIISRAFCFWAGVEGWGGFEVFGDDPAIFCDWQFSLFSLLKSVQAHFAL